MIEIPGDEDFIECRGCYRHGKRCKSLTPGNEGRCETTDERRATEGATVTGQVERKVLVFLVVAIRMEKDEVWMKRY